MLIKSRVVLGLTSRDGKCPIFPGDTAVVDDEEGRRAVEAGYAWELDSVPAERAVQAAPVPSPGENPPEGENAWKGPSEGSGVDVDLEAMTYTELKAMAKEIGIETGKLKSKAQMIDAITGVSEFPNLAPQEVIEE